MTHIPNINRLIRKFITETILNSDIEIITELMEKTIISQPSILWKYTISTILPLWLKEDCIESPEEMANIILEAVIIKLKQNKLDLLGLAYLLNFKIKTIKSSKIIIHSLCTANHSRCSIFLIEDFCRTKTTIIVITH